MVLDVGDNSGSAGDSFYTGGNDGQETQDSQDHIDVLRDDFPKPILRFYPVEKMRQTIEQDTKRETDVLERLAERRLTTAEREAVIFWQCKARRITSYGLPLGMLGGAYRTYTTAADFKFPFLAKRESFNPDVFKVLGKVWFEGHASRHAWHILRYFAYAGIAGPCLMSLLMGSYGISRASVGRANDPRIKDLIKTVQTKAREEFLSRKRIREGKDDAARQGLNPVAQADRAGFDDASPSASSYSPSLQRGPSSYDMDSARAQPESFTTDQNMNPGSFDDKEKSISDQSHSQRTTTRSAYTDRRPTINSQESGFLDDTYDDASPTASNMSQTQSSSGSAWDRVRSGGASTNSSYNSSNNRKWQTDQNNQTPFDSARDETSIAQKEFDARLERERNGRNFD